MKTISLEIPNMKSNHCQMTVKQAVEKLEGAQNIKTESGKAEVAFDSKIISDLTIVDAIEKAGYKVKSKYNF